MALTVTSRGTGTHNTGATTLVPGGRTATLAVGSMGVLCMALDNAGSAGASLIAPNSWTDAKGNVWTLRQNAFYDNGAASAGIEMAIYTAPITVALLTTDLGTMTWKGGASPVAKAWTWYEAIPSGANRVAYSTGGTIAGATAANAAVTTASVPIGDAVIAGYFAEGVSAVTGDSDTTNGSWTAQQTATIGATTSGVRIATQQKVQTTAESTQTYNATVASQDRIAGYILLHEVVDTSVTPGVASLALTAFAPTVTAPDHQLVTPTTASLASATFAPTISVTANQLLTPATAALSSATFAPRIDLAVIPAAAALVTASLPPTVTASDHKVAVPATASLSTSSFAPTVTITAHQSVVPDIATLVTAAFTPSVTASDHQLVTPAAAALLATGMAATVTASDHQSVTPTTVALNIVTFSPTVATPVVATPVVIELQLAAFAPDAIASDHRTVTVDPGVLVMVATAPTVIASDHQLATPPAASLALGSFEPTVAATDPQLVTPDAADLVLTALIPTIASGARSTPDAAALELASLPPDVLLSDHQLVSPAAAALSLSTFAATVTTAGPAEVTPTTLLLVLVGLAPTVAIASPDMQPGGATIVVAATARAQILSAGSQAGIAGDAPRAAVVVLDAPQADLS